ncbi:hypothetical protein DSO57_1018707 [Entomophthora muscae]|uniref:Uncharacterized protein n=1 Tax=Entomophthora muscae TaxID=34485 RepID=A0ACC2UQ14_9FUNG|nr:hypothetical protein DSO57_1018707 [Entomophthora muscae]
MACIIDIQATAYSTAYKVKALELTSSNASRAPLPEYQVGDLVLYYQNSTGGCAHKLDSLWVGPCEVTYKKGVNYTVKLLSSGCSFACFHSKFLRKYQLPGSNLEGGDIISCAINAILIWPLNNDIIRSSGPPAPLPIDSCPPGVPFGPVHFTEYPLKPEYKDYNPEKILELDLLAHINLQLDTTAKAPGYSQHPRKFNYLPAYKLHMEPPVTPKPMPASSPNLPTEYTSKLFGIVYITLTGVIDT